MGCRVQKRHFPSEAEARTRLVEILNAPEDGRPYKPCRVMQCEFCDRWVLTSAVGYKRPTRQARRRHVHGRKR